MEISVWFDCYYKMQNSCITSVAVVIVEIIINSQKSYKHTDIPLVLLPWTQYSKQFDNFCTST